MQPKEVLCKAWNTPRLKYLATNVLAASAHFNAVAFWIMWEVTYERGLTSSPRDRARVLLRFIEVRLLCWVRFGWVSFKR